MPIIKKPKINKTNRIIVANRTIYCSSVIASAVKEMTILAANNRRIVRRGMTAELGVELRRLNKEYPGNITKPEQLEAI